MKEDMTIIITMAGLGSRFREAGYDVPKYMIKAKGKTLFDWSLDSLQGYEGHASKYIFIVRKEDSSRDFILSHAGNRGIKEAEVIELDHPTDGQATTAMMALSHCEPEKPIMIYNIDTYVEPGELKFVEEEAEGLIPCFKAEGTHWSFVKLGEDGLAIEVKEKVRISDNCSIGAYYFSSAKIFSSLYDRHYSKKVMEGKNEKYIAPLYNYLIAEGGRVKIQVINPEKVHVLGTPEELDVFLKS